MLLKNGTICNTEPCAHNQGLLSILSRGQVAGLPVLPPCCPPRLKMLLLDPLRPLSGPFLVFAGMWATLPVLMPGLWRSLLYWQRLVPVLSSFFITDRRCAIVMFEHTVGCSMPHQI